MINKNFKIIITLYGLFFLILIFPLFFALAQSSQIPPETLNINIFPENPEPGDKVKVSVSSFLVDLNKATITWSLNGNVISSGLALAEAEFTAGTSGRESSLVVSITASDGRKVSRSFKIIPSSVDLIYEAVDSLTPPFYKGKALVAEEGLVKVVAVSNMVSAGGFEYPASSLLYTWKRDGTVLGNVSGIGKKEIFFRLPVLSGGSLVEVEVSSPDGNIRASKSMTVNSSPTEVLTYENNPLFGILFNKILSGEVSLEDREMTVVSYPLFFSSLGLSDERLIYRWRINNSIVGSGSSLTLRAPEESGTSNVSISVENRRQIMQSSLQSFKVNFGVRGSSNPFFR